MFLILILCSKNPAAVYKLFNDEFKIAKCPCIPLWLRGRGEGGGAVFRDGWKVCKTSGNGGSFLKCSKILGALTRNVVSTLVLSFCTDIIN